MFGRRVGELAALAAILWVAFGLRLYLLGESNIWWDEGLAVWAARQSLGEIAQWTARDVHPPLYFWLLHGWVLLVGESEFAVRWLSAAAGTLTVAVLYTLGRALLGQGATGLVGAIPWLGALFLATSRFAVWWSQEARMYVVGGLLVTLGLWITVRLRRTARTRGAWLRWGAAYLLVMGAALWSLYLLAFVLVVVGLFWIIDTGGEVLGHRMAGGRPTLVGRVVGLWGPWAVLQGAVLLAFAPWLTYALPRMQRWSVQVPFDQELFARLYAVLLTSGVSIDIDRVLPIAMGLLALVGLGVGVGWRVPGWRPGLLLLLLALVVPPLVVWAATTTPRSFGYSPKPEARYFLPYAPAFSLLLAWTMVALVSALPPRWQQGAAVLLVVGVLGWQGWTLGDYYQGRYLHDDYRSVAATLRAYWRAGDAVLLHTDQPWPVFAYHWDGPWAGVSHIKPVTGEQTEAQVETLWARAEGLWLVLNEDAHRLDPQHTLAHNLERRATAQQRWRFGAKQLLFFARTPDRAATSTKTAPTWQPAPPQTAVTATDLLGWEIPLQRYRPGEVAHLFVTLAQPSAPITPTEAPTLILGPPSQPVAQATAHTAPHASLQRLQFDLHIPGDTAPGVHPWLLVQDGQTVALGEATVLAHQTGSPRATTSQAPVIATPLEATFGTPPLLKLLGYEAPATARPGETIHLTLYWQALQPISVPYKVFTHVISLGPPEQVWGGKDDEPVGGLRPTTSWVVGEYVVDTYAITLNAQLPAGTYHWEIGMYDAATGARLGPVQDRAGALMMGERILLGPLVVR